MIASARTVLVLAVILTATPVAALTKSPLPPQPVLMDRQDLRHDHGGRAVYVLNTDFSYCSPTYKMVITVPRTFVTDLMSIPNLARWIKSPDSPGFQAAIIHDWLYASGRGDQSTRNQADYIFYEAMGDYGVDETTRYAMYRMVQKFGKAGYGLKNDWFFADLRFHKNAHEVFARAAAPATTPVSSCNDFVDHVMSGQDYLSSFRMRLPL